MDVESIEVMRFRFQMIYVTTYFILKILLVNWNILT